MDGRFIRWSEDEDDLGQDALLTTFLIGKTGYYDEFRPGAPEMDIWDIGDKLGRKLINSAIEV
ncbi:hypothetical protein H7F50_17570 [Novosphingobium flavum]|uniref:hypothetical protein n=1 Tax=Novosphingobium aerophilum TaxID=2839843 RepID=UPI0016395FCC|nr:hypothetical protein [Novosphingobium aerophilum]MBC2663552.1 hypothetical protein [Novosphingobium aerophilum]